MTSEIEPVESLAVPEKLKAKIGIFVQELLEIYQEDLLTITAFGAAVKGPFKKKSSEIELLIIYSDMNIADLNKIASLAQKWHRICRLAPLFHSKHNFLNSAEYFQLELLRIRNSYRVLYGQDILEEADFDPESLRRQISFELKTMRPTVKQEYWKAARNLSEIKDILARRFSRLKLIGRGLLILGNLNPPKETSSLLDLFSKKWKIDRGLLETLEMIEYSGNSISRTEAISAFTDIMDLIRLLDTAAVKS